MPSYDPAIRAVSRALRQRCGIKTGQHLLVAVSGGADSVALLRILALLAPRRRWQLQLTVAHVQHHLRDEAQHDAHFVEQLAHSLHLPYLRRDLDPTSATGNIESWARQHRYQALRDMAQQSGAQAIVTAHHGDDQLETVLMRLLRGASVTGLAAMRWQSPPPHFVPARPDQFAGPRSNAQLPQTDLPTVPLIRPMLALTHADNLALLRVLDQSWCEDATNQDHTRTRAMLREVLRSTVLPQLGTHAGRRITAVTDHLRDIADWLDASVDLTALENRSAFRALPRAVAMATLRQALIHAGASPDRVNTTTLQRIYRAATDTQGQTRHFDIAGGIHITMTRDEIRIEKPSESES